MLLTSITVVWDSLSDRVTTSRDLKEGRDQPCCVWGKSCPGRRYSKHAEWIASPTCCFFSPVQPRTRVMWNSSIVWRLHSVHLNFFSLAHSNPHDTTHLTDSLFLCWRDCKNSPWKFWICLTWNLLLKVLLSNATKMLTDVFLYFHESLSYRDSKNGTGLEKNEPKELAYFHRKMYY